MCVCWVMLMWCDELSISLAARNRCSKPSTSVICAFLISEAGTRKLFNVWHTADGTVAFVAHAPSHDAICIGCVMRRVLDGQL